MPVLATLPVRHAMRAPRLVLSSALTVGMADERLDAARLPGAPVRDASERYLGVMDRGPLDTTASSTSVDQVVDRDAPVIGPDDPLDDALGTIADSGRQWAPVVEDDRLVGVLSVRDAMAGYRAALAGSVRQVRHLHDAGVLLQAEVGAGSSLDGVSVGEVPWPSDTTLVSIERDRRLVVPKGDVRLMQATG